MECFYAVKLLFTPYLVTMETHIYTIFIKNYPNWYEDNSRIQIDMLTRVEITLLDKKI